MNEVRKCPDCNAHYLLTEDDRLIIVPNHRLPEIRHLNTGKSQYINQEDLTNLLADYGNRLNKDES